MHTPTRESAAPTPPALEELQEALPQYEILALIGSGGMGAVYRARQRSLNREVAIKVLRPGALDEFRLPDRFRTEAHAMARLNHPAIVHVHDFGETADGILFIVMECVHGTDLHRVLDERSPLAPREAVAIAIEVCAALEYAHGCGVVHRDIKPGNVLLTAGGHVKVADFGLAKIIDLAAAARLTAPDLTFGTANYAAPETLRPNATVDHRADIYAAGVMLYQMLTGLLPRGMFRLPSQKSGCDPRLDAIVCRALETEPADRFQSAHEMGLALAAIQDSPAPSSASAPARRASALALTLLGSLVLLALAAHSITGKKNTPPRADTKPLATRPQQAAAASQPVSAEGRVIDLLAAVELKRDALDPGWIRDANGLALTGTATDERWGPRLQLPYQPPAEYEVITEFTPTSEGHAILQLLSAQGRGFAFVLGRRGTNQWTSGFEGYDRLSTSKLTPTATLIPANLETGRRYRSRVEVRTGSLRAWLDEKPLIDWSGDFKHLGSSEPVPDSAKTESPGRGKLHDTLHLGLRSFRDVVFHSIAVREISGPGKLDAPLPASADGWQDLLPEINPSRHTLAGRWRFEQKELTNTYSTGATALIELPLKAAVNYDLRLNLRYLEKYTGHLAFTLPHGERTGRFVIDDYRSPNAGLEYVDGRSRLDVAGVVRQRTAFLPQGEPCELLFQVRDEGLRVLLNGSELYRWAGDWSRVTTVPAVPENQPPRPFCGLGCKDGKVLVSSIAARLLAGPGGEKLPPAEVHGPPPPAAISLLPPSTPLEFESHRYQYVPGAFTWPTARKNAEKMGGHLVTIDDAREQDWLWRTYSRFLPAQAKTNIHSRGWWTGGIQAAEKADWQWSTGEPFHYVAWAINEPGRNRPGPYYVLHHGSAANALDSAWTARPPTVTSGFVVEWDSPAPPPPAPAPAP